MNRKRNQGSSIYIIAYNYIYKFNTEKFNIVKLFGICLDKVCSKQAIGEVYPNQDPKKDDKMQGSADDCRRA